MHNCLYCSYPLLRHIQHHKICWFCPHCWTKVPVFSEVLTQQSLIEHFETSRVGVTCLQQLAKKQLKCNVNI